MACVEETQELKIKIAGLKTDSIGPWDRALLGEDHLPLKKPSKLASLLHPVKFASQLFNRVNLKFSAVKVLAVFLIFALAGFFLFKNPTMVMASLDGIKRIVEQTSQEAVNLSKLFRSLI